MPIANRLAGELSPYLLQHAHNPVAWQPWSDEAFAEAARRDVPVLVSIGYSACHWCHVMEHESFADESTAQHMNANLVCIKVDREERPDIDALHMEYLQRLSGHGGWPLNVFVTPERVPFYGGTYFPPHRRGGMPSWLEVVDGVCAAYQREKGRIQSKAQDLAEELSTGSPSEAKPLPPAQEIEAGITRHILSTDPVWGGFPGAPKFPPHSFLAMCLAREIGSPQEAGLLRLSLDRIGQGGIRDHVGGGFARYSTDEHWIVPHFEKMLYDNAQLLGIYAQAAAVFGEPRYARIARDTASWMRQELADPEGGYRCALDADSEGEEGAYYVWKWEELSEVLGNQISDFAKTWNCSPGGNFEGANVLWRNGPEPAEPNLPEDTWRSMLFTARQLREKPGLDYKVLASWNGLTLAGLSIAGARLADEHLLRQARGVAKFCLRRLRHEGGLWSVWKRGQAKNPGTLEDWAFLGDGLLELWLATQETPWLDGALDCADQILQRFGDPGVPTLRFADKSRTDLFAQVTPLHDNATPSGNGVAARLFAKLHHLTGREDLRVAAQGIVDSCGDLLARFPRGYSSLADAWRILSPKALLAHVDGPPQDPAFREMKALLQRGSRIPDVLVVGRGSDLAGALALGFAGSHPHAAGPTAWICRGTECLPPVHSPAELRWALAPEQAIQSPIEH
ncbi:MAG: thioredoxin domain-containing protein [Fibrobacteres bacterium]|nr:thioredoxin domain-containing protein [Fibrobacterota bacterium]